MRTLTAEQREVLEILQEECAEVIHAASKMLRHGPDSRNPHDPSTTNEENLAREIGDVVLMVSISQASGALDLNIVDAESLMKNKLINLATYGHHITGTTLDKIEL